MAKRQPAAVKTTDDTLQPTLCSSKDRTTVLWKDTFRFIYETGDAAGQNMTTNVTWHACNWALTKIGEELQGVKVEKFFIECNLSGDKKMAAGHLHSSRGWFAQAEAWIPEQILRSVLKASL